MRIYSEYIKITEFSLSRTACDSFSSCLTCNCWLNSMYLAWNHPEKLGDRKNRLYSPTQSPFMPVVSWGPELVKLARKSSGLNICGVGVACEWSIELYTTLATFIINSFWEFIHLERRYVLLQRHESRNVSLERNHEALRELNQVTFQERSLHLAWSFCLHASEKLLQDSLVFLQERLVMSIDAGLWIQHLEILGLLDFVSLICWQDTIFWTHHMPASVIELTAVAAVTYADDVRPMLQRLGEKRIGHT